jgi:hypothetical protein
MAITIVEQPQTYTPLYNDIVAVISSNKTTEAKFKFCLDVKVNIEGLGLTTLGRLKTPVVYNQLTGASVGFFNVKELLQGSNFFATKNNYVFHDISHPIQLVPGEEYASAITSAPVYYAATGQTMNTTVFNGALRLKEYIDFVPTDLINTTTIAASSGIGQYPLTTFVSPRKILQSSVVELSFLCNGGTNTKAVVTYYNGSTSLGTQDISVTTANKTDITVDVSPSVLTIPLTTTKYTVQLKRISNGNALSDAYTYEFDTECTKFDKVNVYFQNKWGGYDNSIFAMRETKTDSIDRKTYEKPDRYVATYNYYNLSQTTYSSKISTQHILNTNWVDEPTMNWLSELVESNSVLMSYNDELEVSAGVKASIDVRFDDWNTEGTSATTDGRSFVTPLGSLSFSIPSGTFYETYADDWISAVVIPALEASGLNTNYDFINVGDASTATVRITAKNYGSSYSFTSNSAIGATTALNLVAGVDDTYTLPTLLPVKVDTQNFVWKKQEVDKLFQLQLTVTETPTLERQYQ